jgi:hypothetical protein
MLKTDPFGEASWGKLLKQAWKEGSITTNPSPTHADKQHMYIPEKNKKLDNKNGKSICASTINI